MLAMGQTQNLESTKNSAFKIPQKTHSPYFKYDMQQANRPKSISVFESDATIGESNPIQHRNPESEPEPFAQINEPIWGELTDVQNGEIIFYSADWVGNTNSVTTYDQNMEEDLNFSIELPESANMAQILRHHSTTFFSNDNTREFFIYVHYFNGTPGPNTQVWEVWAVNSNGEILAQLPGVTADAKIDSNGNKKVFTYLDNDATVKINAYDPSTWDMVHSYSFNSSLIYYYIGMPFDFIEIDGEEFAYVARYKHLFMDNATMEIYPDNNLVIELLDLNLEVTKTMYLDIESRFPDLGPYVAPMANFGNFYRDQTYDISKNIFNSDEKLEVVYGIHYYDMIADEEWDTYMVANEDGDMLHEYNEVVIFSYQDMASLEGHDNQLGFLVEVAEETYNIVFFDIESWQASTTFGEVAGGDQLTVDFNRVAVEDTYHYLIGLAFPDEENGTYFGVINEFDTDASLIERHRFTLFPDSELFQPILTSAFLTPNLFYDNDQFYFAFVEKERDTNGQLVNHMTISGKNDEPLFVFYSYAPDKKIIGANVLTTYTGSDYIFDRLAIQYEPSSSGYLTDIYRLPLYTILGVDEIIESSFVFYPNPTTGAANFKASSPLQAVQVYDMGGKLVFEKQLNALQETIDLTFLNSGIYFAKVHLQDGGSQTVKFIKR